DEHISFLSLLNQHLKVMDSTAISLCMDNQLPLVVFNLKVAGNFKRVAMGERCGTTVTADKRESTESLCQTQLRFAKRSRAKWKAPSSTYDGIWAGCEP